MRGFGHMDAHDLTLPLDPPTGLVSYAYQERRTNERARREERDKWKRIQAEARRFSKERRSGGR